MKVLITGAGGQLGRELAERFEGHDVVAAGHDTLDVGERDAVLEAICGTSPDVVVHAAAWTDVDGCELDPERALRVNALGTRHVAEASWLVNAHVCYLSTDHVFDGEAGRPYDEWDDTRPVNLYGRSKLGGERELSPTDTIVRTAWVCGRHGHGFVHTVLRRAAAGDGELPVVDDQVGSPTLAADLAGVVRELALERRPGTFHVTNQGAVSRYELARDVLAAAGLDQERVRPIATADLSPPPAARRPRAAALDNAALRLSGLPLLPHYREPLARLVKELVGR